MGEGEAPSQGKPRPHASSAFIRVSCQRYRHTPGNLMPSGFGNLGTSSTWTLTRRGVGASFLSPLQTALVSVQAVESKLWPPQAKSSSPSPSVASAQGRAPCVESGWAAPCGGGWWEDCPSTFLLPSCTTIMYYTLSEMWVLGLSAPSPVAMRSCGTAARRAGQPRAKGDCALILSIRAGPAISQESRGLSLPSTLWPLHLAALFSHLCPL